RAGLREDVPAPELTVAAGALGARVGRVVGLGGGVAGHVLGGRLLGAGVGRLLGVTTTGGDQGDGRQRGHRLQVRLPTHRFPLDRRAQGDGPCVGDTLVVRGVLVAFRNQTVTTVSPHVKDVRTRRRRSPAAALHGACSKI